jgi:hypothetical protein
VLLHPAFAPPPAATWQDGKIPKALEDLIGEEAEEVADVEMQIPAHKVKLVVGAGGEKIKFIQKKSKCRIQVSRVVGCAVLCRAMPCRAVPCRAVQCDWLWHVAALRYVLL